MQIEPSDRRLKVLMQEAIERIGLDLSDQVVLTEAASGPFISTPVLAGMAGARKVFAVTKSSQWGDAADIKKKTMSLSKLCNCDKVLHVSEAKPIHYANEANIVTNLNFVRPISRLVIEKLAKYAVIALMWEPWEFRPSDIDFEACRDHDIVVIATNEHHPNVATFHYVGMLSLKLLLEVGLEVFGLNLVIIGSDPFGNECSAILKANGAKVTRHDPTVKWPPINDNDSILSADAIIVVEHQYTGELIGEKEGINFNTRTHDRDPIVIHICGVIDYEHLSRHNVKKYPANHVEFGHMTVTTAYVGPKPVVDLHCAGLHAASIVSRARRNGKSSVDAVENAVASGYGLALEANLSSR